MANEASWIDQFSDGSIWKNPNFQSLLSGLAGTVDQRNGKKGVGGQVGSMFQNYIQSVEAQKAMEKKMKEDAIWTKLISRLLGGEQKQTMPSGPYKTDIGTERMSNPMTSSKNWLSPIQNNILYGGK